MKKFCFLFMLFLLTIVAASSLFSGCDRRERKTEIIETIKTVVIDGTTDSRNFSWNCLESLSFKSYTDEIDDVSSGAINLTELSVYDASDSVCLAMSILELSSKMLFNPLDLATGDINYEWATYFDLDSDQSLDAGDIGFVISKTKYSGDPESLSDVLKSVRCDIVEVQDAGGNELLSVSSAYLGVKDGTLYLGVYKDTHPSIFDVFGSQLLFRSKYDNGQDVTSDQYPDVGGFSTD